MGISIKTRKHIGKENKKKNKINMKREHIGAKKTKRKTKIKRKKGLTCVYLM
jgi:hypothetical protein